MWYHCEKRAVFCSVCTQHKQPNDKSPLIFVETDTPSATGFCKWKKGIEQLREHGSSDDHIHAMARARRIHRDIASELDMQSNDLRSQRRNGLVAHLNTLKTIQRQGIAVRGHTDAV